MPRTPTKEHLHLPRQNYRALSSKLQKLRFSERVLGMCLRFRTRLRGIQMSNTTAPRGLSSVTYNALLHAIWKLDDQIRQEKAVPDSRVLSRLQRDRDALHDLFVRLG